MIRWLLKRRIKHLWQKMHDTDDSAKKDIYWKKLAKADRLLGKLIVKHIYI